MQTLPNAPRDHFFLSGGGEMGELTRNFNWAETSIGTPESWPQSLRTTVGNILHSPFPMVLFWGNELICFYNDAYRVSLGEYGKHPALGKKAPEVWHEVWEFVGPLIEKVTLAGESVWFEDQLIPVFRNNRYEDVYWTFSYSPAYGDNGTINGVFIVCTETTEKVLNLRAMEESERRFRTMAEGSDMLIAVADENSHAIYFNKPWTDLTGRSMEDLLQFGWLDLVHPDDRDAYFELYQSAFRKQESFKGEFRVLNKRGEYVWLLAQNPARFNQDGSFAGYISSCVDITERKETEDRLLQSGQQVRSLVESAPFPIGVYVGKEMRIRFTNQSIMDVWGKGNDVIGKTYAEVLPELANTGIYNQLDHVYTTGEAIHMRNERVDLVVDGRLQIFYFNYSFTPLYDEAGNIYGVMNTAAEVTDLNVAKQQVEQSERNLKNMIIQAPVAMCMLMGPKHVIEVANDLIIELWGKPRADVMNKPVFEALPDAAGQGLEQMMENVYNNGETFSANEMPVSLVRNGEPDIVYQNFVYQPYRDADGTILGIIAITIDVTSQVMARLKIE